MSTEVTTATADELPLQKPNSFSRAGMFLHDVREEMRKVVTPGRSEVRSTTIVVIVTVFIFAAYFELVDLTLGRGIDAILLHLTKH